MITSTVTQNSALYLAQHKASKSRAALFRQFRDAARDQSPDVGRLTFGDTYIRRRFHRDNGR